jgi:hypothetical protein
MRWLGPAPATSVGSERRSASALPDGGEENQGLVRQRSDCGRRRATSGNPARLQKSRVAQLRQKASTRLQISEIEKGK